MSATTYFWCGEIRKLLCRYPLLFGATSVCRITFWTGKTWSSPGINSEIFLCTVNRLACFVKNSADAFIYIYFFSQTTGVDILSKLSPTKIISTKRQSLISGKMTNSSIWRLLN